LSGIFTVEHAMAYAERADPSFTTQQLAVLERAYRRDLQDVAAARASCISLREVADRDEQEILRALERIDFLLKQKTSRHVADRHEEAAFA
jgi:hypothetical protein